MNPWPDSLNTAWHPIILYMLDLLVYNGPHEQNVRKLNLETRIIQTEATPMQSINKFHINENELGGRSTLL